MSPAFCDCLIRSSIRRADTTSAGGLALPVGGCIFSRLFHFRLSAALSLCARLWAAAETLYCTVQRAVKQTATARFEKTGFALANRDAHWKHDYRMEKRCFEQLVRDLSDHPRIKKASETGAPKFSPTYRIGVGHKQLGSASWIGNTVQLGNMGYQLVLWQTSPKTSLLRC